MIHRKTGFALLALIGTLLATGGVASAHTVRFDSRSMAFFVDSPGPQSLLDKTGWDRFFGRVSSHKAACRSNRVVAVYLRRPGEDPDQRTRSDKEGFWSLYTEDPPNGTYYAWTPRKVLANTAAHKHICKPVLSHDMVVTGQP